jgi:hypothetical protein
MCCKYEKQIIAEWHLIWKPLNKRGSRTDKHNDILISITQDLIPKNLKEC